jgi:hypothetical protein
MDGRTTRILVWVAIAPPLLMDALYLGLIRTQGGPPESYTVPFVSGYLLVMVCLLVASIALRLERAPRAALRAAAAAGLIVLGVIAAFSIGLPILIAGVVALVAAVRTMAGPGWISPSLFGAASGLVAVAVLIAGFEVTERLIVCPAHGYMGGGGTGFITGPYHYQCVNGRLHWASGLCTSGGASIDANGNVVSTSGC